MAVYDDDLSSSSSDSSDGEYSGVYDASSSEPLAAEPAWMTKFARQPANGTSSSDPRSSIQSSSSSSIPSVAMMPAKGRPVAAVAVAAAAAPLPSSIHHGSVVVPTRGTMSPNSSFSEKKTEDSPPAWMQKFPNTNNSNTSKPPTVPLPTSNASQSPAKWKPQQASSSSSSSLRAFRSLNELNCDAATAGAASSSSSSSSSSGDKQPEWMQKFQKIGMKGSEENIISTQGLVEAQRQLQHHHHQHDQYHQRSIPSSAPSTPTWNKRQVTKIESSVIVNASSLHMQYQQPQPSGPSSMSLSWKKSTINTEPPVGAAGGTISAPTTPNWMSRFENNISSSNSSHKPPGLPRPPVLHHDDYATDDDDDDDEKSVASVRSYNGDSPAWMDRFGHNHKKKVTPSTSRPQDVGQPEWMYRFQSNNGVSNMETTTTMTPQQTTIQSQDFSGSPQTMVSSTPSSPVTSPSSRGGGGKMIMPRSNMPFPNPPMHSNRGLTSAPSSPFSNRGAFLSSFDVSGTALASLVGDSGKLGSAPIGIMSAPNSPTVGVVGKARPSWMLKLIQKKKGLPEEHSNKSGTPPWKKRERLKEEQARKLTEDLGLSLHNIGDENQNSADYESSDEAWDSDGDSDNEPESVPEWMQQFRKMHLKEARIVTAQGKAPQKVTCLRNSSAQMIKRTGDIVEDSEIVRPITVRSLSSKSLSSRSLNVSRRGARKEKALDKSQHVEPSSDGNVGDAYRCSDPEAIHRVGSLMRKESISTQAIMSAFSMDQEFPSSGSAGINAFRESADDSKSLDRTLSAATSTFTSEKDGSVWSEPTKEMTALEKKLEGKPELDHQSGHTHDLGYQSLHTHVTKDGWGAQVEIDNSVPINAKGMWGERVNSVKPGNVTLMSFRKIRNQADRVKERIEKAKKGAAVAQQETKDEDGAEENDISGSGSNKMTFDADESASALFFKDLAAKSPTPSDKSFSMDNSAANIFGFGGGTVLSPRDETSNVSKLSDFVEGSSDVVANESRAWDTTHAVAEEPAGFGASFSQMQQIQEENDEDDKSVDDVAGLRNKFKSFAEESVFGDIDENDTGELKGTDEKPKGAAPHVPRKSSWLEDSDSESASDSEGEKPKEKPSDTRPNKPLSSFEGVSMVSTATAAKQKADTDSEKLWAQPVKKKSWLDDSDSDSDNDSSPPKAAGRAATSESPVPKPPVSKKSWLNDSEADSDDSSKNKAKQLTKSNSVSSAAASKTTGSTSTLAADSKAKTRKDLEKKKSWLDGSDSDSGSDDNESASRPVVAAKKATPPPTAASKPPISKKKSWLDDSDSSDDDESAIEPLTRKKSMTPMKSEQKAGTVEKVNSHSPEKKVPTKLAESSKEIKLGGSFFEPTDKKNGVDKTITMESVFKKDDSRVDTGGKAGKDDDLFPSNSIFANSLHGADQAKKEEDEWQAALEGLANEMEQEKEANAAAAAAFDSAAFGLDGNGVKSDKKKRGKDTKKGSKVSKNPNSPKMKSGGSPKAKSNDTAKSTPIGKKNGTKKKVSDVAEKKEKTASFKSDTKGDKKQSDVDAKPVAKLTKSKAAKADSESKSKKSKKKTKAPEGSKARKSTLTGLKQSKRNLIIKPASKKLVVAAKTTPARSGKKLGKKNAFDDEDSFMMNGNDFDDDFSVPPDFGDFAEDGSVVPLKAYRHPPSVKSKKKAVTTGKTTTTKTKNKAALVTDMKKNKKKEGKGTEKKSMATKKKKKN